MKMNKKPARWSLGSAVAAAVLCGACSSTPTSDEEPIAQTEEPAAEAPAPQPAAVATEATTSSPAPVAPIPPYSPAYYAERLQEIESGLRPLTSIPVPISSGQPPPRLLYNNR